jgi:hypothetical protein
MLTNDVPIVNTLAIYNTLIMAKDRAFAQAFERFFHEFTGLGFGILLMFAHVRALLGLPWIVAYSIKVRDPASLAGGTPTSPPPPLPSHTLPLPYPRPPRDQMSASSWVSRGREAAWAKALLCHESRLARLPRPDVAHDASPASFDRRHTAPVAAAVGTQALMQSPVDGGMVSRWRAAAWGGARGGAGRGGCMGEPRSPGGRGLAHAPEFLPSVDHAFLGTPGSRPLSRSSDDRSTSTTSS